MNNMDIIDIADDDNDYKKKDRERLLNRLRQRKHREKRKSQMGFVNDVQLIDDDHKNDSDDEFDEDDFDPLQSDSLSMLLSSTTPPVSSYDGVIPIADNSDSYYGNNSSATRRNHQLYWTPEDTRSLIAERAAREMDFQAGILRKVDLWAEITQKLADEHGITCSMEKISKKWHNIMITYQKNVAKKDRTGHVNWEFFDEIDVIFNGQQRQHSPYENYADDSLSYGDSSSLLKPDVTIAPVVSTSTPAQFNKRRHHQNMESHFKIEHVNGAADAIHHSATEKMLINAINNPELDVSSKKRKLKPAMVHDNADDEDDVFAVRYLEGEQRDNNVDTNDVWKTYLDKKLDIQREKMRREDARHKDKMNFQKMTLMLQEKMEKSRIEAINNLTNAINRMTDTKKIEIKQEYSE